MNEIKVQGRNINIHISKCIKCLLSFFPPETRKRVVTVSKKRKLLTILCKIEFLLLTPV